MSNLPSSIVHGYLFLADISGYTSFLSQTELDHAQEILGDLIQTVITDIQPLLTIHKIEGDAVFAYVPDGRLVRGETLLELIDSTYLDFRERMKNVRRHTTCTCRACQSIPLLDLKFIVHHGEFAVQHIGGSLELAGSDVNLAHRLLKNRVYEQTGCRAYALFTEQALEHMGVRPEPVFESSESYEHLGEARVCVQDMHPRYEALLQARRVVVDESSAMVVFGEEYDAPPEVVWSWMNEPDKRRQVSMNPAGMRFIAVLRPGGRTQAGATTHCVHGANVAMREVVLDWKPFDYFTLEQDAGPMGKGQVTFRFEPLDGGSRTRLHAAMTGRLPHVPRFLNRPLFRLCYTRVIRYPTIAARLKELLAQAAADEHASA